MAKKPSESTNRVWSKIKYNVEKIRIQDLNSEARQKPITWRKHQNPRNSYSAVKQSPKNPKPKPEFHGNATLQIFHVKKEKIFCKMQDTNTSKTENQDYKCTQHKTRHFKPQSIEEVPTTSPKTLIQNRNSMTVLPGRSFL
jgi:hypothetical protein